MKKKKTASVKKKARAKRKARAKKITYYDAILKKKKSVTFHDEKYDLDVPKIVDGKTARYLRNTGLFKVKRIKENVEV